jgi:hypothetical protein
MLFAPENGSDPISRKWVGSNFRGKQTRLFERIQSRTALSQRESKRRHPQLGHLSHKTFPRERASPVSGSFYSDPFSADSAGMRPNWPEL